MQVDRYISKTNHTQSLVLPQGNKIEDLKGQAAEAVAKQGPWQLAHPGVSLGKIANGDLFEHLNNQLAEYGAGMYKTEITVGISE